MLELRKESENRSHAGGERDLKIVGIELLV